MERDPHGSAHRHTGHVIHIQSRKIGRNGLHTPRIQAFPVGESDPVEQGQGQQALRRLGDQTDTRGHGHGMTAAFPLAPRGILRLQLADRTQIHPSGTIEPVETRHANLPMESSRARSPIDCG